MRTQTGNLAPRDFGDWNAFLAAILQERVLVADVCESKSLSHIIIPWDTPNSWNAGLYDSVVGQPSDGPLLMYWTPQIRTTKKGMAACLLEWVRSRPDKPLAISVTFRSQCECGRLRWRGSSSIVSWSYSICSPRMCRTLPPVIYNNVIHRSAFKMKCWAVVVQRIG